MRKRRRLSSRSRACSSPKPGANVPKPEPRHVKPLRRFSQARPTTI